MLDSLFGEEGEARRVADVALERASTGREPSVAYLMATTQARREVCRAVLRRMREANLMGQRREEAPDAP